MLRVEVRVKDLKSYFTSGSNRLALLMGVETSRLVKEVVSCNGFGNGNCGGNFLRQKLRVTGKVAIATCGNYFGNLIISCVQWELVMAC